MLEISLQNYRRFVAKQTVSFLPGLTLVLGPNGAGKTTLVEAITYALFGKTNNTDEILSDSAEGSLHIHCSLQVDGQRIDIVRGQGRAELSINRTCQVSGQAGSVQLVNAQLRSLLAGLTRDQFESIYVAEQGDTAGLLAKRPAVRKSILEGALQMDVLRSACDLQKEQRDQDLTTTKTLARPLVTGLGMSSEQQGLLAKLEAARVQGTRFGALDLLLSAIVTAGKHLDVAATAADDAARTATEITSAKLRDVEHWIGQAALLGNELAQHEGRFAIYQGFDGPLAEQTAYFRTARKTVEGCKEKIIAAQLCSKAAASYKRETDDLERIAALLGKLPLRETCWADRVREANEVERLKTKISGLGDTEHVASVAENRVGRLTMRRSKVRLDPVAAADNMLAKEKGRLDQQSRDMAEALRSLERGSNVVLGQDAPQRCPTCNQPLAEHARSTRLRHVKEWLAMELPRAQAQLEEQAGILHTQRLEWNRKLTRVEGLYDAAVRARETAIGSRVTAHGLQLNLLEAESRWQDACTAWHRIAGEAAFDPTMRASLEADQQARRNAARELKQDADQYDSLPRLRDKYRTAISVAWRQRIELAGRRAQRAAVGYDKRSHQDVKNACAHAANQQKIAVDAHHAAELAEQRLKSDAATARKLACAASGDIDALQESVGAYKQQERLATVLNAFRDRYFQYNTEAISQRASELILQAITDGSIHRIEFLANQELRYRDASYALQPVSRLSGGEKAVVGVCLRIALAEQALRISKSGRMRFLILDEVLGSLDEERLEAMQTVFDNIQRTGLFEHVILVTHLESVRQNWQGSRLNIRKLDSKSSAAEFMDDLVKSVGED